MGNDYDCCINEDGRTTTTTVDTATVKLRRYLVRMAPTTNLKQKVVTIEYSACYRAPPYAILLLCSISPNLSENFSFLHR